MPDMVKFWAGRIFGTNTGNFFLGLDSQLNGALAGTLRLMDTIFGIAVYDVTGRLDGDSVVLRGQPSAAQQTPEVNRGTIDVVGSFSPDGNLRGTWISSIGTGGTFVAFPHDQNTSVQLAPAIEAAQPIFSTPQPPEQLYLCNLPIGAVRIYHDDLWNLVEFIRRDFLVGRPVITFAIRGNEVSQYLDDFLKEAATLGTIGRFKLTIQEPEAYGINKMVVLDLNSSGKNELRVQGINEPWVTGKAEMTARMLNKYQNGLVTFYKKFGLTLNQIIFLGMLVVIPAIPLLWKRAIFVCAIVAILYALLWVYQRLIPNARLYLSNNDPNWLQKLWPKIFPWIVAFTAPIASGLIFKWLTK